MTSNSLPGPWLLLIHQLPVDPAYVRVKVSRRLKRLGALAIKSSVYVLPNTDEHLEDLQWLANEIAADGGDATICAASMLSGVSDADLAAHFHLAGEPEADESRVERPRGATWVTRQDVFVDRMASAWLIRRFIDPQATFRFVAGGRAKKEPGALRFDMYNGEFTHVGDRCTFETLVAHFGLDEPGLRAIAEIVHDIDLKDEKFGRPEAESIASVLKSIRQTVSDDQERIDRAAPVFETLLASHRAQ